MYNNSVHKIECIECVYTPQSDVTKYDKIEWVNIFIYLVVPLFKLSNK